VLRNQLFAIRKSDLGTFQCNSGSVCGVTNGSTNAYLIDSREIEEFLLRVEPNYNAALTKLQENSVDQECIHTMAGFVAYVGSCAPAAMRIPEGELRSAVESTAMILDRQGLIPNAPPSLGSKTLTELMADGSADIAVDQKYAQAIGINTILSRVSFYGNSPWEILLNDVSDSPFFTSDFPIAIEAENHRVLNWIVPLAPNLAIRIKPDRKLSGTTPDLSFAKFTSRQRKLQRAEIRSINRLVVRCAEDLVFYREAHPWVEKFVDKNRHYRIEAVTERIPYGTGFQIRSVRRIVPYRQNG